MTRHTRTLSDLLLERYHLGEVSDDEAAVVRSAAASDAGVRIRLTALAASDAAIRARYPDAMSAAAVSRRMAASPLAPAAGRASGGSRSHGMPIGRLTVAAAAAVVVVAAMVMPGRWGQFDPSTASPVDEVRPGVTARPDAATAPDGDRVKGDAAELLLHRKVGSTSELLADGDAARRGDLIRLAYRTSTPGFGVIVSIDGRGLVTRHLPASGATSVALQPGSPALLDTAYELDDAPRWERFYLVTDTSAFDVQMVLDAAQRAVTSSGSDAPLTLPLPQSLAQTSFLLRKPVQDKGSR